MQVAKWLSMAGFVIMLLAIVQGFVAGDFSAEGSILLNLAWGRVTLIDLYLGFLLFAGWMAFREPTKGRAALWIVLLMLLGNLTAFAYVWLALNRSNGDWRSFWLGARTDLN